MLSRATKETYTHYLAEYAVRCKEALRLYEPMEKADIFHRSLDQERIISGSNRSGKTQAAVFEFSRAVCGEDPYGKYPKEDGIAIIVGENLRHISKVIYPLLFEPGSFKIVRDPKTGLWRTYKPWVDVALKGQAEKVGPAIPWRWIKTDEWYNRKAKVPKAFTLSNGWQILFASSDSKPIQGIQADLVWIDEEITNESWYTEMAARMMDRGGRMFWSACPHLATEHYYHLHRRAERGEEGVSEVNMRVDENPYISTAEREKFRARLKPSELKARYYGEYAIESLKIFPDYTEELHCVDSFEIPHDWTRYMAVDPGSVICGVLFAAVPPPGKPEGIHADKIFFYKELYIQDCTARKFGESVAAAEGNKEFYEFYMDSKSGLVRDIGSGKKIWQQYSAALKKRKFRSTKTGHEFLWGSTDVKAGLASMRDFMELDTRTGQPKIAIMKQNCPMLHSELDGYLRKVVGGFPTDDPRDGNDHLIWGARVMLHRGLEYHRPISQGPEDPVYAAWQAKQKKRKRKGTAKLKLGSTGEHR